MGINKKTIEWLEIAILWFFYLIMCKQCVKLDF